MNNKLNTSNLSCGVYYKINAENCFDINKYICISDDKIHVRLRDFKGEQIIKGFEMKLTYLLTYLINYSFLPTVINQDDTKAIISNFSKTRDFCVILKALKDKSETIQIKDIKIRKNYNKSRHIDDLGDLDINCFPINVSDDNKLVKPGSLNYFLSAFNLTLENYLFNDNIVIVIGNKINTKNKEKYIDRMDKRLYKNDVSKYIDDGSYLEQLW